MLNVGLIGLGYWGEKYFRLLSTFEGINFVACAEIDSSKHIKDLSDHSCLSFFTDFRQMLKQCQLDAVIVATPADTHFDISKIVLESKVHLLVEKPMTTSSDEAKELIQLASENKRILMVGHTFLFDDNIKQFKKAFYQKFSKFDHIKSIRQHGGLERFDVNCVWDLMAHDITILNHFIGNRVISIQAIPIATCLKTKKIGAATISLKYLENISADIELSWLSDEKIRKIEIFTNDQRIEYNYFPHPGFTMNGEKQNLLQNTEPLKDQLECFIRSIKENTYIKSSGQEAYEIVSLLEAADYSIQNNGVVINFAV